MEPTSTAQSLIERLKAKTQQEQEQIERLTQSALQQLADSLKTQSAAALTTTEHAIQRQHEQLRQTAAALLHQTETELRTQAERAAQNWTTQIQSALQRTLQPAQETASRTYNATRSAQQSAETLQETLNQLETHAALTRRALIRATAIPLVVAIALLLTICGIGWGVMQYQLHQIQEQTRQIESQRGILEKLPPLGVHFYPASAANDGKPLFIFPPGTPMNLACGPQNQPCVLLEK